MFHSLIETVLVFDLDDTLYSERCYEASGIAAAWKQLIELSPQIKLHTSLESLLRNRKHWIEIILNIEKKDSKIDKEYLLTIFRNHYPEIELYKDSTNLLSFLVENSAKLAMITDGRSVSQRLKLKALNIEQFFNPICISEEIGSNKPNKSSYEFIEKKFEGYKYIYIGDNPKKDFVTPNKLGWYTYGLKDRGSNVHPQNIQINDPSFQPSYWLNSLDELIPKIQP
jgi:putative hydrolase of the HAD superfamily